MTINETSNKVSSLSSFLKELPTLNAKIEGSLFYRGQSNYNYDLVPSVLRESSIKKKEDSIYNEIMTECAHEFDDCKLNNEILSKMQHYDVPTRLLDLTTNPLVALFFACKGNSEVDGAVYILEADDKNIKQKPYDSDAVSILSALPRFNFEDKKNIKDLSNLFQLDNLNKASIADFNSYQIIKRLLHEIKKEKPAFENIINPKDILSNFIFIPRKTNARIIRQSGAFIIFGLNDDSLKKQKHTKKIIVDSNSKKNILNQLSCFGISEGTLYPELYKVAEHIKAKHGNK